MYNKKVINRFKNPKFAGEIKNADAIGEVGNVRCGDIMKIYLKIKNNVIQDIKFMTYGCPAAIAASDMLCELAKGKTLKQALKINAQKITKNLGELPPIKYHCSILGGEALTQAINNYLQTYDSKNK
ncbi:MAG: iron-sulfur cluster assembly scaffold protein [Patescibacteria group bacterium]|jgi:nitrogen fixation NifU-like protein|nr:iron-sulfur cluster assembly scaffold protein [Patescibacteria group bacterium]